MNIIKENKRTMNLIKRIRRELNNANGDELTKETNTEIALKKIEEQKVLLKKEIEDKIYKQNNGLA